MNPADRISYWDLSFVVHSICRLLWCFGLKELSSAAEIANAASESQELLFFSYTEHCTECFKLLSKILKMFLIIL